MGRTRLGVFAENLEGGGVEKVLETLLRHFDYTQYEVSLITVRNIPLPDSLVELPLYTGFVFDSEDGSVYKKLKAKVLNKIKLLVYYHCSPSFFYHLFINNKFDIAIAFIEGYATRIVSGAPNTVKRIAWLHCDIINHHWTKIAYRCSQEEIECYHCFDDVVCVSSGIQEQLKLMCGDGIRTRVVLNCIDRDEILNKASSGVVTDRSSSSKTIRLISLGRLAPVKGYDRLIWAVRQLTIDGYDIDLTILGEGAERGRLQKIIEEESLNNRVHLLGFKDNPYPFIKASDLYVCSSISEGYNTAVAEALVLGKAVVSTDCMKGRDLLGDSEYGIVTENSDNGLYDGIKSMLKPDVLARYMEIAKIRGRAFCVEESLGAIYHLLSENNCS